MIEIFKTVTKIFDTKYTEESRDFKRGFLICFDYFEIGFKKNPAYNHLMLNHKLKKELENTKTKLDEVNNKLAKLEMKYSETLDSINITETNFEKTNATAIRRKIRVKLFSVVFSNKTDSEKVEYFKSIFSSWLK